jgi:GABA permease
LFLLNSSGAVILFIYLLIAISQVVLRRRTSEDKLIVKMWFYPVLSILVILAIAAILASMLLDSSSRTQLFLSALSVVIVVIAYFLTKKLTKHRPTEEIPEPTGAPHRVLVLASETVEGGELLSELHSIDKAHEAEYFICVPANPIDTGQAMYSGPVYVWDATTQAAKDRLDRTLSVLESDGLPARGSLGDFRPLRALSHAVEEFKPDRLVICTHAEASSAWLRYEIVDRAHEAYPNLPIAHVVVDRPQGAVV